MKKVFTDYFHFQVPKTRHQTFVEPKLKAKNFVYNLLTTEKIEETPFDPKNLYMHKRNSNQISKVYKNH